MGCGGHAREEHFHWSGLDRWFAHRRYSHSLLASAACGGITPGCLFARHLLSPPGEVVLVLCLHFHSRPDLFLVLSMMIMDIHIVAPCWGLACVVLALSF